MRRSTPDADDGSTTSAPACSVADDAVNQRTIITVPGTLGGSGSVIFVTSNVQSNVVTITHNRGATGYAVALTPTLLPATAVSLVVLNKTANTFQVQGVIATKASLTLTFDWVLT